MRIFMAYLRGRRSSIPPLSRSCRSDLIDDWFQRITERKYNWRITADMTVAVHSRDSPAHLPTGFLQVSRFSSQSVMHTRTHAQMSNFEAVQNFVEGIRRFRSVSSGKDVGGAGEWTAYDPRAFTQYYRFRPFQVAYRAMILISEVVLLSIGHALEKDIQKRAEKLRRSLTRLGAFYIKLGQALSTRPDILPIAYCQELSKLQDHVPPYPTSVALEYLQSELGSPASKLYAYITPEPVAAASLGQVYKALLHSGEMVAVKVQRPGVTTQMALDTHLLLLLGGPLRRFTGARSDLLGMINEMVVRMFEEIDYVREGRNAERFSKLYGMTRDDVSGSAAWHGLKRISLKVSGNGTERVAIVPKVYWDLTSKGVLTMEWIDGLKLTDAEALKRANLDVQNLVDQGVFCSLRQLLDEGFFHADPHPGNLVVTKEGKLAYFDFGMMSEIRKEYRVGLIRTIVHFVNRDSLGLAKDFILLGFIPEEVEIGPIAEALNRTFGLEGARTRLDFQGIMAQLSDVMYQFHFRLPPEYTLVIRALGSLEGTATTLDPDFKVVASAYPFIVGRLLADPDPAMREILRELLIRNNGSIRWHRLERLVFAIAEQSTSIIKDEDKARSWSGPDGLGKRAASGIEGTFNTRAVASATMDMLDYILSGQGLRIRTLLVQDITQTFEHLFWESVAQALHIPVNEVSKVQGAIKPGVASKDSTDEQTRTPPIETGGWLNWSQYISFGYWGRVASGKLLGTRLWQDIESGTRLGFQRSNVNSLSDMPTYRRYPGIGNKVDSNEDQGHFGLRYTNVDDFANRLDVGFQVFTNAVNSAPDVWIPLIIRLASKSETCALASAIFCSLGDVYYRRTSEAFFLSMSRALHNQRTQAKLLQAKVMDFD